MFAFSPTIRKLRRNLPSSLHFDSLFRGALVTCDSTLRYSLKHFLTHYGTLRYSIENPNASVQLETDTDVVRFSFGDETEKDRFVVRYCKDAQTGGGDQGHVNNSMRGRVSMKAESNELSFGTVTAKGSRTERVIVRFGKVTEEGGGGTDRDVRFGKVIEEGGGTDRDVVRFGKVIEEVGGTDRDFGKGTEKVGGAQGKVNRLKRKKMSKKAKLNELRFYRLKAKRKMRSPNPETRIKYKLGKAKRKEEWLIQKLRKYEIPTGSVETHDPEILTEEERFYIKRIGEKKKHYVPLGRRGAFGGVVLNMHQHWLRHETVKVSCRPCRPGQIHDYAAELARLSHGIIIDIKPDNTILFYRGKNYVVPEVTRPPDTLSKAKAMEKYKFEQSLEHTSVFIERLEKELEQYHKHLELYKSKKKKNEVPNIDVDG